MKKFLALLFVCAGLTAMATAPQINKANFTKKAKISHVMKANTLAQELSMPAMKASKDLLTPKKFFKDNNLTPDGNRLAKKAPRRLTMDDVLATTYLDQTYIYTRDSTDAVVEADPYYVGGGGVSTQLYEGQLYVAGFYWNENTRSTYYLPLDIDFTTGDVVFSTGTLLDDDTIQGRVTGSGGNRYRVDTVDYSVLVPEDWDGESAFSDITGKIYSDGSIEFNDELGYELIGYRALVRYKISGSGGGTATFQSGDTTWFDKIYRGTQFLACTGTHEFQYKGSGSTTNTIDADIYMYQRDDTTVVAFNLFTFGMPGCQLWIYEDGTMYFPGQYVYDDEGEDAANGDFELDANHGFIFDSDGYVDGFNGYGNHGNVTNDAITWDATVFTYESGSLMYPFFNNKLTYYNDKFLLGKAAAPTITVTEGEDAYTYTAVATEDGTTAYLFVYDPETETMTMVDNPYIVPRTDADQEIVLVAIADGYDVGKNESEPTVNQFVVPGLVNVVRGDVNKDGNVGIADVTALINALLTSSIDDTDTFSADNADTNKDGSLTIQDVTVLINFLLTQTWPN